MQKDKTLAAVFITVFTGFIGFSLPFPIFSYLFLSSESILIPATVEESMRPILLGLAIALFPIGQALASPLWGKYSDRYGRKPMLIISLMIAALGMVIVAIAIQYNLLYLVFLGRFISGLGEGNITLAQAIAADQQNEKIKARYFAAISIAMNSGWIVGPLLGGYLGDPGSASFTHPTLPFWLAALMYLCNILVIMVSIKETREETNITGTNNVTTTELIRLPAFRAILLLSLVSFFGTYILFSFFAPYLVQVFQSTPTEIGIYSALLSVPLILAGLWSAQISQRLGYPRMTFLALALLSLGLLFTAMPDTLIWIAVPVTLAAFGIVFIEITTAVLVSNSVSKAQNGHAMGVYRTTIVLAEIIAGILGGLLSSVTPALPFLIASAVVALGFIVYKRNRIREREAQHNVDNNKIMRPASETKQ